MVEAVPYDEYVKSIVSEIRSHNPDISIQLLSSQLQVPEHEIMRIEEQRNVTGKGLDQTS